MKIFRVLLLCICLTCSIKGFSQQSQTITLSVKKAPLETILSQIKKQTGVSFFYKKEILKKIGKISIQVNKATLQDVLDQCLQNTQIAYTFSASNLVVLIVKDEKKKTSGDQDPTDFIFAQTNLIKVQGFVYNTLGERLNGASVIIKRSHKGTTTKVNGEFELGNVDVTDTLRISFMGYTAKDVPISSQTEFVVMLKETDNQLDMVEVQAYGLTTKRFAMGEISQLNAKDLERQPVSNPMLALKGLVPGVLISPTSGYSNAPVKVEIRGRSSIDPGSISDPLYIIDGVPLIQPNIGAVTKSSYSDGSTGLQQAGFTLSKGQSPFANLNIHDIESITVLKDAAATAMYGSRGGNGVIIINTKKGKPGKTELNVNVGHTINQTMGRYDMLNTSQYLQMRREALQNDGLVPSILNAPDIVLWDSSRNVDWQKELWKPSNSSNADVSISGGNDLTTFRISGQYINGRDLSPLTDKNLNKSANASFNLNHHSLNQKLSVDIAAAYGYGDVNQIAVGGTVSLAPNFPAIFDERGNLNYTDWNASNIQGAFPFSSLLVSSLSSTNFLNSSLRVAYHIVNGLDVSLSTGYNLGLNNNTFTNSIASQNPRDNPTALVYFGNSKTDGWNVSPQINYSRLVGQGKITATLGGNLNSSSANGLTTIAFGYTSDLLARSINNAPFSSSYQDYAQTKYLDVHGSLNFIWGEKYIFEVSGNRDGSSNFGPGRQFGSFGVAGLSWIASEEKWLKKLFPFWISFVKFKGSFGTTGAYPNIAYQYLSQWSNSNLGNGQTPLFDYNGVKPQVPIHAVNQDYRWETNKELNMAMDLGFLKDRVTFHAAVYRKRTNNQLAQLPTAIFTGFESVQGNSQASVQNSGLEASLNLKLMDVKDFSWRTTLNFSSNQNKLLAFPGIAYSAYYTTRRVGESLNTIYLLHYLGVDPQTGQRAYQDFDKNGVITITSSMAPGIGDDKRVAIDLSPKFGAGVMNSLSYKNVLTLSFDLIYQSRTVLSPYARVLGGRLNDNIAVDVFNNHWQKPGDVALYPRFSTSMSDNFSSSDGAYINGSFLRLQNAALNYALPDRLAKKIGMQRMSFMISMQNVFTLTKYPGIDPEVPFAAQPQPKVFSGRLSLTF
jgi:TonB-linked SusC/RagA family outer membrane protein